MVTFLNSKTFYYSYMKYLYISVISCKMIKAYFYSELGILFGVNLSKKKSGWCLKQEIFNDIL